MSILELNRGGVPDQPTANALTSTGALEAVAAGMEEIWRAAGVTEPDIITNIAALKAESAPHVVETTLFNSLQAVPYRAEISAKAHSRGPYTSDEEEVFRRRAADKGYSHTPVTIFGGASWYKGSLADPIIVGNRPTQG